MAEARARPRWRTLLPVAVLAIVWGANWPILKLGVSEIAPLTFRGYTLAFAGLGLLAAARLAGDSIRVPRAQWSLVIVLALLNITAWNALVLFGLQQLPAGRSVILAYTMPVWATIVSLFVLREPIGRRKAAGLALGVSGMLLLLGEDLASFERRPLAAVLILGAAVSWACGTVLLRKHKPPIAQNTLGGWMMIVGWAPLALAAPLLDANWLAQVPSLSRTAWFAILYNVFLAGTLAHWAWFTMARTLPVAVSSLAALPVPVVGVLAGMLVLGERPGWPEWAALALVLAALAAVMWPGTHPRIRIPTRPR